MVFGEPRFFPPLIYPPVRFRVGSASCRSLSEELPFPFVSPFRCPYARPANSASVRAQPGRQACLPADRMPLSKGGADDLASMQWQWLSSQDAQGRRLCANRTEVHVAWWRTRRSANLACKPSSSSLIHRGESWAARGGYFILGNRKGSHGRLLPQPFDAAQDRTGKGGCTETSPPVSPGTRAPGLVPMGTENAEAGFGGGY